MIRVFQYNIKYDEDFFHCHHLVVNNNRVLYKLFKRRRELSSSTLENEFFFRQQDAESLLLRHSQLNFSVIDKVKFIFFKDNYV